MKRSIVIKRFTLLSLFKIMAVGCSISLMAFALLMGLLALFGAETVQWNGGPATGFSGLLAAPFIGVFLAVFGTIFGALGFAASFWVYSRYGGRMTLEYYLPGEPETESAPEDDGHARDAQGRLILGR